ncbi:MAG: DUF177 domain-containing protein [Rhodospirillaceae bacterium]|nr:DUF177 domain-containing protein [Rhodospirillaceae bacterium]MBT5194073.1 DUF177 domain-containing protein [Rhodospirillaceae bacterium]MBT5899210.1 DUF177 domain-containing protein [Rhodospirillaceae bacterium]MBT7761089.1 DUF177 domain-containing protein [Rhodospirillaceae bacterium]
MPEFSRLVQVDVIDEDGTTIVLRAEDDECAALARRLDLQGLSKLRAKVNLRRTAAGHVRLNVDFSANVVQSCVVSLEAAKGVVSDRFSVLCEGEQKRGKGQDAEGEVFVDPFGDDPVEPLDDGRFDVGELVAQNLSLSLDPYPRAPGMDGQALIAEVGAELVSEPQGNGGDERENPFAALEQLRQDEQGKARELGDLGEQNKHDEGAP